LRHRDSSRVLRAASRRRDPDGEAGRRSVSALRSGHPKENDKILVIEREVLLDALRRVSIIASDKTWGIRLILEKGSLAIEADNPDLGNAREKLDVEYKGSSLQIGFNARYFIDLLTEMASKNVRLELGEDLDPAVIRPADDSDYLGVVMPMRL